MKAQRRTPVAGVLLAAGRGSRLAPLTRERPKPLCPVGNRPLLDLALDRLGPVCGDDPSELAVNLHHGAGVIEAHLEAGPWAGAHRSLEWDRPLGTAGALVAMRRWLDGRAALVVNADAWTTADPGALLRDWDGQRPRVLVVGEAFGPRAAVAAALVPWHLVVALPEGISGLYETVWAPLAEMGTLEVVCCDDPFVDCGTPARYLEANLRSSGGVSVVDPTALVSGAVERAVVWAGAEVSAGERLVGGVRTTGGQTVLVR